MILAALLITACGSEPDAPEPPPPPPEETILGDQAKAMNRARDVRQTLQQSAEDRLDEVDRIGRGEESDEDNDG